MKTTKFKSSEVGPIPVEWEVKRLGDCCARVKNGFSYDFRERGEFPVSRIETISSGKIDYHRVGMIETPPPTEYLLKAGDILYSHINSLPYIGNVAQYGGERPLYHGMNLLLLRPVDEIDAHYLHYVLASEPLRRQARMTAKVAINQASINTSELKNFPIRFPPRPEQERIAEALSDVDALLSAMTTLIEKKRAIKQGAMQQLLTGKKRLAGFTGPWVEKRLEDCGKFSKGAGISRAQANTGDIPAVRYGELYTTHNDYIKAFESFISEDVARASTRLIRGDIVFACSGETKEEIGKCAAFIGDEVAYAGGDLIIFSPTDGYDSLFLAFELNTSFCASQKAAAGQGDAVVHIRQNSLAELLVRTPPTFAEQKAIAAVLSDMDAELAALESKRAKYESVKQGMMQELLTGKTRLV